MYLAQTTGNWTDNLLTKLPDTASMTGGWHIAITIFLIIYVTVLVLLSIYGLHRYVLVYLYYKYQKNAPRPAGRFEKLPKVCIQLPMFNEQFVARRIIERTCEIEYPKDRLQIQVLDDSTDSTVDIASSTVEDFKRQGFDIQYIHRTDRTGYKEGALANGMKFTDAEFVAIFDADFIPPHDILQKTNH